MLQTSVTCDPASDIAALPSPLPDAEQVIAGNAAESDPSPGLVLEDDLHSGDLVVHDDHGLGRFEGLETVADEEMIRLRFADDGLLLVPAREAGKLWRHGHDEGDVPLDHLMGSNWTKRRAKLARKLLKAARRLVRQARRREEKVVATLAADHATYRKVASAFPWDETPDQTTAIDAVLADLAAGRPMHRLVIGDVGFGKTEIAIRAIAAAAGSGVQVALIAPTTVLAHQHAQTLSARLDAAGIEVASLSRLNTSAEARAVRARLADGSLQVVVGTHALLGRATRFANLGLIVIDEEQRFGKVHKKALRKLGRGLHVLSMTATPIPSSLQQALIGIQDLSVLGTAPCRRKPVRTVRVPADPETLCEALTRERARNGRSFVVVPRIEDIAEVAEMIRAHCPDLILRIAHGDLPAEEIDAVITEFAGGEGDVLLATTIIEAGLDVPGADTMAILRPDLFGLGQLHQLRGRVGRGDREAHCLLMTDPAAEPSRAVLRRLDTLVRLDGLGAGFRISRIDLDRRGGGDPSEDDQSGHDARIGPALHADLLGAALQQMKGKPVPTRPQIRVDADASLPLGYVRDADTRATLYNRLGHVRSRADVEILEAEIAERFGAPPAQVARLLRTAVLMAQAMELGLLAVFAGPGAVAVTPGKELRPRKLPEGCEWSGDRIVRAATLPTPEDRLDAAFTLLADLAHPIGATRTKARRKMPLPF